MKSKAILVTFAMVSAALAGCTGSDGVAEVDEETLQQLFDDNIQDFMNNTSVTVIQEIHYHNNTTSVDNSESVTNFEGGGQGMSTEVVRVIRVQENYLEDLEDYNSRELIINGELQFPSVGFAPVMSYTVGGDIYSFSFNCQEAVNVMNIMSIDGLRNWAREEFQMNNSDAYSLAYNMYHDIQDLSEEIYLYCSYGGGTQTHEMSNLFLNMQIPEGESISFKQLPYFEEDFYRYDPYFYSELSCEDGYNMQSRNTHTMQYIGGWSDCDFSMYINLTIVGYWDWSYEPLYININSSSGIDANGDGDYDDVGDIPPNNNTSNSTVTISGYPSWSSYADTYRWYRWTGSNGTMEIDSVVYYSTKYVIPVE